MAEAMMKDLLERMGFDQSILVKSAGTWAQEGHPATPLGITVMAKRGLDTSNHKSEPITKELTDQFDLILTMEAGHKEAIQIEFPENASKVFMLSEMSGASRNIEDPVGGTLEDYQNTAEEIENWLRQGLPKILDFLNLSEK